MTINEAAGATGLSTDTIRFYEKSGMLPPVPRDHRGWRIYPPAILDWLKDLARLRATGMPLPDMKRFAVLVHTTDPHDPGVAAERLRLLTAHKSRLAERRAELDAAESYLDHKISVYERLDTP